MKKSLLLTVLLVFVFMVSFSLAKGIPLNSTTLPDIKISQNQALSYAFSLHNYHEIDDYSQCSIIQNFMDKVTLTSWGDVGIGSIGVVTSGTVIIRTDDGMSFSFLIKVVPYTLKRLPYVFLNKNQSTEFNLQGYCIDSEENPVIPLSFGTPGGLDARESDGITVQWTSDSTISITADSTFSTRARYWVYACDTTEADTQESIPFDREELFIFPNEIAQGGFDSQDDYNLWATDYLSGTMALPDSYWVASDTDTAGESANGVLRVDFTTNNSAIKITPSLSQMPTVEQGDWMIARMRVCCDEADNNFEGSLFNFRNVVESGAHVNVAGHVWFGMPTTWTWIETPVYCSDSGIVYPQLIFSLKVVMPTFSSPDSVLIGSIKVDEVQLIRATPQLLLGRNFIREMFAAGQFKYTDDLTDGWSVEPLPSLTGDNAEIPEMSVDTVAQKLNITFSGVSTEGAKFTANDIEVGIWTPYSEKFHEAGIQIDMSLPSQTEFVSDETVIVVSALGTRSMATYDIGEVGNSLFAAGEFGKITEATLSNLKAVGRAVSNWHQVQWAVKTDQPGTLILDNADFLNDNEEDYIGDENLF